MCLARHHPLRQPSKRGSTWSRLLNRMPGTFSTNNTGRCFVARPYSATLSKAVKNSRDSCAAHTASGEGYGAHVLRDGSSTIHVTTFVQGHTSPCSASPFPLADTSVHGVVMTTRSRHWPVALLSFQAEPAWRIYGLYRRPHVKISPPRYRAN